jgi:hypothetical protein
MVIMFGLVDLLALFSSDRTIAHAAHLAGGVAGYLYGRRVRSGRLSPGLKEWFARVRGRPYPGSSVTGGEDEEPDPEEIDTILEKIKQRGIHSLTRRERRLLDRASGKE